MSTSSAFARSFGSPSRLSFERDELSVFSRLFEVDGGPGTHRPEDHAIILEDLVGQGISLGLAFFRQTDLRKILTHERQLTIFGSDEHEDLTGVFMKVDLELLKTTISSHPTQIFVQSLLKPLPSGSRTTGKSLAPCR